MKRFLYLLWAVVCLTMNVLNVHSQNCQVNGIVTNKESHKPITNANIVYMLDGKKYGCTTNSKGIFSFALPQGKNTTIKVTHIGYKTISKLVVGNKKQISLKLELVTWRSR